MKLLWKILVPTVKSPGKFFSTKHHQSWDAKVQRITGGLTVLKEKVKGKWTGPNGESVWEEMIPVHIMATREEMDRVCDITLEHYNQEAVLAWVESADIVYKERPSGEKEEK